MNQAQYNTGPWHRLVMCQEVGHDFGLDHQDENFSNANLGTCMDYTNDPDGGGSYGPNNEHPNAHDYEQLDKIYGHLDSMTTATAGPGRSASCGAAVLPGESVGRLGVRRQPRPGPARVTFVLWTPFGD
jgi:hypothetical protein